MITRRSPPNPSSSPSAAPPTSLPLPPPTATPPSPLWRSPFPPPLPQIPTDSRYATLQSVNETRSSRPELTTASRVVVGGRGVGDKAQFDEVFALADKLGAAGGVYDSTSRSGWNASGGGHGDGGRESAGGSDGKGGRAGALRRSRRQRLHPAPGGNEGLADHRVCEQGPRGASLLGRIVSRGQRQIADFGLVADLHAVVPELLSKLSCVCSCGIPSCRIAV